MLLSIVIPVYNEAGGIPALPVLVQIPWTTAVIIAVVIAAFPVLIAPLAARTGETISVLRQGAQE